MGEEASSATTTPPPAQPAAPPGFEGFEKRLEVEFSSSSSNSNSNSRGLRDIRREELTKMLKAAECTIVSEMSNAEMDSYVLSESSLFIYSNKMVLKTCGTTQLLKAIPTLLSSASLVGFHNVARVNYTRGEFLFPHAQPFPHRSFQEEVLLLDHHFSCIANSTSFLISPPHHHSHNWHIYTASSSPPPPPPPLSSPPPPPSSPPPPPACPIGLLTSSSSSLRASPEGRRPTYTLEMCMTKLSRKSASCFFKSDTIKSGEDMTKASGINNILPSAKLCDFAFDPCGYSMNAIQSNAHSTIHITPEPDFSYASFESMGYGPSDDQQDEEDENTTAVDLNSLIGRVLNCFHPAEFTTALRLHHNSHPNQATISSSHSSSSWGRPIDIPEGYTCTSSFKHNLLDGALIVYHTFRQTQIPLPSPPPSPSPSPSSILINSTKILVLLATRKQIRRLNQLLMNLEKEYRCECRSLLELLISASGNHSALAESSDNNNSNNNPLYLPSYK